MRKQSQLFTGVLGTIFQILGAMVDAFLAPLMPYFVKLIRRMVTWIPWAQEKGEQFANWIQKILDTSGGPIGFIQKFLKEGFINSLDVLINTVAGSIINAIKGVADEPIVGDKKRGLTVKEALIGATILGAGAVFPPIAPITTPAGIGFLGTAYAVPEKTPGPTGPALTNSDGGAALNGQMFNNIFAGRNSDAVYALNYSELQDIPIFKTP